MAAVGGGRSTLANQGSLYHVSWRPRLPDAFERAQEGEAEPRGFLRERQLTGLSTRVIIQFLSICFIVNRPKARQIKWVKSDPVSAAFFLGNHNNLVPLTWFKEKEMWIRRKKQPSGTKGTTGHAHGSPSLSQAPSIKLSRINGLKWLNLH